MTAAASAAELRSLQERLQAKEDELQHAEELLLSETAAREHADAQGRQLSEATTVTTSRTAAAAKASAAP